MATIHSGDEKAVIEPRLEVADIFRQHGQEFLNRWGDVLSRQQRKAFRDISVCRRPHSAHTCSNAITVPIR